MLKDDAERLIQAQNATFSRHMFTSFENQPPEQDGAGLVNTRCEPIKSTKLSSQIFSSKRSIKKLLIVEI